MPKLDPHFLLLAQQIGEQIAVHLAEKLRQGEMPVPQEYLTAFQVGQLTGFTPKALESMRARREGPAFLKVGASVRYRAADVRSWIEGGARS